VVGDGEKIVSAQFFNLFCFLLRGSLLPLGCEAALTLAIAVFRKIGAQVYDCYAAEREQAPSPQGHR
jgi:hypothetical protein